MGRAHLLTTIDHLLDSPVGATTLRDYFRTKRNRLATHGTLAFSDQPEEVRAITHEDVSQKQFRDRMDEMRRAVSILDDELARIEERVINSGQGVPE
jgi:hypothetical protein